MASPAAAVRVYAGIEIGPGAQKVFTSRAGQNTYFNNKAVKSWNNVKYINRAAGVVQLTGSASEILSCNYISFNNVNQDIGPVYAQITDVEQVAVNVVRISFVVDEFQTWSLEPTFDMLPTTIVREHLTQNQKTLEEADPYRMDILELVNSEEDLPMLPAMEVSYNDGLLYSQTGAARQGVGPSFFFGFGAVAPVANFGGSLYARDPQPDLTGRDQPAMLIRVAAWSGGGYSMIDFYDDLDEMDLLDPGMAILHRFPTAKNFFAVAHQNVMVIDTTPSRDNPNLGNVVQKILGLLTANGHAEAILDITAVPPNMERRNFSSYDSTEPAPRVSLPTDSTYQSVVGYEPVNKKLYRFPYRSVVLTTPAGEVYEYEIERFRRRNNTMEFFTLYVTDDAPTTVVAPIEYDGQAMNLHASASYSGYSQASFTNDGFLLYMSARNNELLNNMSYGQSQQAVNSAAGPNPMLAVSAFGGDLLANVGSAVTKAASLDYSGAAAALMEPGAASQAAFATQNAARGISAGDLASYKKGDTPLGSLAGQVLGNPHDPYTRGNASSSVRVRTQSEFFSARIKTMIEPYLRQYDQYLSAYGYTSNRFGVPRVFDFIKGGAAPYFGPYGSYIQTSAAKVFGIPAQSARAIESMFDGGVRFY